VAVLGPVEVRRDGLQLPIPGGKATELLVRLALVAGVRVRTERLIDDLWSDEGAAVGRNTLQSKVSRLRRALGDPALLTGDLSGYTLNIDPGSVDALEVLRLAQSATPVPDRDRALAMFSGDILPGGGAARWIEPYRARLEETRLELTEEHLAALLERGAAGELVAELESLVSDHPLREGLWALLITVLYRADRQADALAAYRRVQHLLADELGLDPGPDLQVLERQILRHDPELAAPKPFHQPSAAPGNLGGLTGSLQGRSADLAAIAELVAVHRLVTVVGLAGVGKTRLAIEVARRSQPADGRWLVRLENARTGASVWQEVGEVFDTAGATEAMVLDRLRGLDLLLVLDNCEQLVEVLPNLLEQMLSAAPGLRVLATSQLPLDVDGEAVYPLDPLAITDAVALFSERASQQRRSFRTGDDTDRVIETVCRSLDGLPLAIELAAARVKALSVEEIARRLGDRFTLLNDPTSHRPPRQRTLRAALAWSYDLLFPDDQRGLWALSCFSGGAPLAAVEHVLGALGVPTPSAIDVVGRLVDRSLISLDVEAGGAVRYRLLDSVRDFSSDRLRESGSADVARGAHAAWFGAAALRAEHGVRGPEQSEHLAIARSERANIDEALTWTATHDPLLGLQIARGFGWSWVVIGAGVDGADRIRHALIAAGGSALVRDRAYALLLAGWLEASAGNLDRASSDIAEGMAMADDELRSVGQLHLSFVRSQQGRAQDALDLLEESRVIFHHLGLGWEEAANWVLTAWAETARGEMARGKAACDEALRLIVPIGDNWGRIHAEAMLGGLAQAEHRFADAAEHLEQAAEAAHRLGFRAAEAHHLTNLGWAEHQVGDQQRATATLERAIDVGRSTGDLRTAALAQVRLGRVLRALGQSAAARTVVEAAQRWYALAGGGDGALLAEWVLAALDVEDDAPDARERISQVLTAAHTAGDIEVEVLALDTSALAYAKQERVDEARTALAHADQLMPAALHLLTDSDRIDREQSRRFLP
jgi:predicted ATPase/DNA-binding SARP family transcriptional activator/predicted negative regulator of RcsB-dependent stress response